MSRPNVASVVSAVALSESAGDFGCARRSLEHQDRERQEVEPSAGRGWVTGEQDEHTVETAQSLHKSRAEGIIPPIFRVVYPLEIHRRFSAGSSAPRPLMECGLPARNAAKMAAVHLLWARLLISRQGSGSRSSLPPLTCDAPCVAGPPGGPSAPSPGPSTGSGPPSPSRGEGKTRAPLPLGEGLG